MKILFISPIRKGGPYNVLKNLSLKLNGDFYASLKGFILGFFSKKYDIIHTVLPVFFNIWNKPILLHIHGDYTKEKGLKNPLAYLYPLAIKRANIIIVPSYFLKKQLDLGDNCKVIVNPISENIFKFSKQNYQLKDELNLVIMTKFHFYDKAKGVINLINVLNKFKLKINLDILGSGIYLEKIQKEISTNGNLNINFKGFVKNPANFLINKDIFVYYSHLDTFGVALAEAMGLGLPVISNEFGAANEVILNGKNGFVALNEKDYFEKLNLLISDLSLRKRFGENSVKYVNEKFSLKNVSNDFINQYNLLLNKEKNEK